MAAPQGQGQSRRVDYDKEHERVEKLAGSKAMLHSTTNAAKAGLAQAVSTLHQASETQRLADATEEMVEVLREILVAMEPPAGPPGE